MQHASVAAIVEALNASGVRYLLVGGLAVVAHGHVRFTADIDIVVDLERGRPGPPGSRSHQGSAACSSDWRT